MGVADEFAVFFVDNAVAVDIFIDVVAVPYAGAFGYLLVFGYRHEAGLAVGIEDKVAVAVLLVEIAFFFKHTDNVVAVELSHGVADSGICEHLVADFALDTGAFGVELQHLVAVERESEAGSPLEIAVGDVDGVESKFKTFVAHLAGVYPRRADNSADVCREGGLHKQVVGVLEISVEYEFDSVVEEGKVEAGVPGVGRFPFELVVGEVAGIEACAPCGGYRRHHRAVCVVAGVLVADKTPAEAQFGVGEPAQVFEERFVFQSPRESCRGEPAPAVLRTEGRCAVGTEGGGNHIAVVEIVVKTSVPRFDGEGAAAAAIGGGLEVAYLNGVHVVEEIACAACREVFPLGFLRFVTGHHVEAVLAEVLDVVEVLLEAEVVAVRRTACALACLLELAEGHGRLEVVVVVAVVCSAEFNAGCESRKNVHTRIGIDKSLKAFVLVLAGKGVGQRVGVVYAELVVFLIAPGAVGVLGGHFGKLAQSGENHVVVVDGVVAGGLRQRRLCADVEPLGHLGVDIDAGGEALEIGAYRDTFLIGVAAADKELGGVSTAAYRYLMAVHGCQSVPSPRIEGSANSSRSPQPRTSTRSLYISA